MLKLNASYSKKVPAEGEYSSQSYHASVEVELPDGLTPAQLQERIHSTFEMVRTSVESELQGSQSAPAVAGGAPASPKQLQYLVNLAGGRGVTPQQLAARFNLSEVRQLSRRQCSQLIDEFNGKGSQNGNYR